MGIIYLLSSRIKFPFYYPLIFELSCNLVIVSKLIYTLSGMMYVTTRMQKTKDIVHNPISEEALELIGYSPDKRGKVFPDFKDSMTQAISVLTLFPPVIFVICRIFCFVEDNVVIRLVSV